MSVSSSGLLSLLPDSEGPDRHAPAAAHSQQNLCHRRVLTDNVAAALRARAAVGSGAAGKFIQEGSADSAQSLGKENVRQCVKKSIGRIN